MKQKEEEGEERISMYAESNLGDADPEESDNDEEDARGDIEKTESPHI